MKILLIGEFSGFHRALKLGLQKLGHEVILAGSPDGFKKIPIDVNLWPSNKWAKYKMLNAFLKQFSIIKGIKNLKGFDVVQFISPLRFHNSIPFYGKWFNSFCYKKMIKHNKKSFLVSCGNDSVYLHLGRKQLLYNPIDAEIKYSNVIPNKVKDYKALEWNKYLAKEISGVIPASYEYNIGYNIFKDEINLSPIIPMPIDTSEYIFNENIVFDNKIRIMHGITKHGKKGSNFILQALKQVENKYSDKVVIDTVERLPLNEYQEKLRTCNILIDQCNSYGYGINALIGLAMGKVVMSGAEPEELNALNVTDCPVINIRPDADDIFAKVEQLIVNKHNIQALGTASRNYVEEVHDAVKVAEQYVNFWNKS